ncbi:MAG: hypothetical protein IIA02_15640 [Proteobacteria bacterium]|uniref:hypothetical protein n=1 Tax=Aquabacterium sp. TaxID=1872578 RepID=UPI0035C75C69|nr:hypothetical protein [Pseudomonadota bacterium]
MTKSRSKVAVTRSLWIIKQALLAKKGIHTASWQTVFTQRLMSSSIRVFIVVSFNVDT